MGKGYLKNGEVEGDALGGEFGGWAEEAADAYWRSFELIPELPPGDPLSMRASRGKALLTIKMAEMEPGARNRPEILDRYKAALKIAEETGRSHPNDQSVNEMLTYIL